MHIDNHGLVRFWVFLLQLWGICFLLGLDLVLMLLLLVIFLILLFVSMPLLVLPVYELDVHNLFELFLLPQLFILPPLIQL